MDITDRELMKHAAILRITASSDRNSLTIYARMTDDVPRATVQAAERAIRQKIFDGKNIRVTIVVTNPETPSFGNISPGGEQTGGAKPAKLPGQNGFKQSQNEWTPKQDRKSQNPDLIFGYDFHGTPMPIHQLEEGMGDVIVQGRLFGTETVKTRNEKYIIKFNLTDRTDSISGKLFCDENGRKELEDKIKNGKYVMISGRVEPPDQFTPELTIGHIKGVKKTEDPLANRMDTHPDGRRTELNLHTKMSDMDGIGCVGDYIRLADKWGWRSLAITDNNSVQAFPDAAHALPKGSELKLIYGVTGSLVNDEKNAVRKPRGQSLDGEFVVFDIETTGFSEQNDRIIEIGAVKLRGGRAVARFSQFIDPERPIPQRITELTTITDDDVRGQGNYQYWIPKFLEFIGDWQR